MQMSEQQLEVSLQDLVLDEIEIFFEEGSKGMPAFAASCGTNCNAAGSCSCTVKQQPA